MRVVYKIVLAFISFCSAFVYASGFSSLVKFSREDTFAGDTFPVPTASDNLLFYVQ